jgi:hypothetical protein
MATRNKYLRRELPRQMHRSQLIGTDHFRIMPVRLMAPHLAWIARNSNLPETPTDAELSNAIDIMLDTLVVFDDEHSLP